MPTNLEAIQAVLASERFLDEPVTEYKPKSAGVKFDLGTAAAMREHYRNNLLEVPGRIVVGSSVITTTPEGDGRAACAPLHGVLSHRRSKSGLS